MRSSEKWGVNVDTAVDLALKELKLSRDEVEVEVLEEPSSGFLGIGSKLAKVRVTAKEVIKDKRKEKSTFDDIDAILASLPENSARSLPDEVREDYDKFEQEEREDAKARAKEKKKERKKENKNNNHRSNKHGHDKTPVIEDELLDKVKATEVLDEHPVKSFLEEITSKMGIELAIEVKAAEGIVYVNVSGKDTETIIGKRGQTLDAIQCLASYVVNKDDSDYIRVVIDSENYRSKREKTLANLANRLAGKVDRTRRSVKLEPMNPYERKIIHTTLQNHPRVKTRSEGKDPYRRVIIERK